MRFFKAFIWLIIVTVPFIGFLYALAEFELPMIGQGNPIANVSYYILSQNENSPMYTNAVLRDKFAQQFIYLGVYKLLVFLLFFWVLLSLIWIILSEYFSIKLLSIESKSPIILKGDNPFFTNSFTAPSQQIIYFEFSKIVWGILCFGNSPFAKIITFCKCIIHLPICNLANFHKEIFDFQLDF